MDLDSLIGELRTARSAYPGRKVKIATHRQIKAMTGVRATINVPIADGSCLGDEDGEVDSLYVVVVDT